MCGIAGAVGAEVDSRPGQVTLRLTRALAHRGPDGEGFLQLREAGWSLASVRDLSEPSAIVLGHRRLSIVDLEGGAQPMANEDGSVWVSYNGEIYNQRELRAELESKGHRFATRSDTEVLLHGWEEWGESMFSRLNGIFAFALADARSRSVVLVRDPLGVKPLYLGTAAGRLTWWSSELQAAANAGVLDDRISPDGLKLFLIFRFVPSPDTIFSHAWKVPPGHFVRLNAASAGLVPQFTRYPVSVRSTAQPEGRPEWREAIISELEAAVRRQLMSDVPVGSLLSGGLDSSLVTQMMDARMAHSPVTFGIGFAADGAVNEAIAAKRAAQLLGVPHESVIVHDGEYVDAWPAALTELGEPIANSGALLVRLLCARVGLTHKVVLSGQGADEPLGGYPRHLVERLNRFGRLVPGLGDLVARKTFGEEDRARLRRALHAPDRIDRYIEIFSTVAPQDVDAMVSGDGTGAMELARRAVTRWTGDEEPRDTLNELLYIDTRMSLADDLLIVGDHFSMRSSVELRVPFLDLQFLELVERMPSRFKISRLGKRKWVYRQAAADHLPPELCRALGGHVRLAKKRGFSTPRSWFESGQNLLGPSDALAAICTRLPVDPDPLKAIEGRAGPRQRSLLYTLGTWSESH